MNNQTHIAPPIQGPSPEVIAGLLQTIERGDLTGGPAFVFDPVRRVFLLAIVDAGAIVHWQIEACQDEQAAQALRARYMAQAAHAMQMMVSELEPSERAAVEQALRLAQAGGTSHRH